MRDESFRHIQVLSDLGAAARRAFADGGLSSWDAETVELVEELVRSDEGAFPQDMPVALYEVIWLAALAPENADACRLATILLLRDALSSNDFAQDLEDVWQGGQQVFREADRSLRAAIMNGFEQLRMTGRISEVVRPRKDDLLSLSRDEVRAMLDPIARGMSQVEMEFISKADYGEDAEEHLAALKDVLARDVLTFEKDEYWFPLEVVQLVSHVPGTGAHIRCLALILLDALETNDMRGDADYRFENQWSQIQEMPREFCIPVMAAFRWLYETDRDWGAFFTMKAATDGRSSAIDYLASEAR